MCKTEIKICLRAELTLEQCGLWKQVCLIHNHIVSVLSHSSTWSRFGEFSRKSFIRHVQRLDSLAFFKFSPTNSNRRAAHLSTEAVK